MYRSSGKQIVIRNGVRIILALVFIFSGFVKGVDPWGTAIKFDEYFSAFSMESISEWKYALSIALSSFEMLLGLMLLFKIRIKFSAGIALIFMIGFTILTLIIAITNPVSDCGCFGDAIKLTNWQSFAKNIVLLILCIVLFLSVITRGYDKKSATLDFITVLLLLCTTVSIGLYSIYHLPVIDFLPYKLGVNIPNSMSIPDRANRGEYKTVLIYKNITSGEQREFSVEDTTWQDTLTWEFIDSRSEEIKKGYIPEIGGFSVFDDTRDVTSNIIYSDNEVFIVVLDKLNSITNQDRNTLKNLREFATRSGADIVCVTTSPIEESTLEIPCYNVDATTIKMMLRAHKGLIVINKGTIIAKWNINDIPNFNHTNLDSVLEYTMTESRITSVRNSVLLFCGIIIIILIVYTMLCKKRY